VISRIFGGARQIAWSTRGQGSCAGKVDFGPVLACLEKVAGALLLRISGSGGLGGQWGFEGPTSARRICSAMDVTRPDLEPRQKGIPAPPLPPSRIGPRHKELQSLSVPPRLSSSEEPFQSRGNSCEKFRGMELETSWIL
jgi:hypothetical protein